MHCKIQFSSRDRQFVVVDPDRVDAVIGTFPTLEEARARALREEHQWIRERSRHDDAHWPKDLAAI